MAKVFLYGLLCVSVAARCVTVGWWVGGLPARASV